MTARHCQWHWQSADLVVPVTGYDPIGTGLEYRTLSRVALREPCYCVCVLLEPCFCVCVCHWQWWRYLNYLAFVCGSPAVVDAHCSGTDTARTPGPSESWTSSKVTGRPLAMSLADVQQVGLTSVRLIGRPATAIGRPEPQVPGLPEPRVRIQKPVLGVQNPLLAGQNLRCWTSTT